MIVGLEIEGQRGQRQHGGNDRGAFPSGGERVKADGDQPERSDEREEKIAVDVVNGIVDRIRDAADDQQRQEPEDPSGSQRSPETDRQRNDANGAHLVGIEREELLQLRLPLTGIEHPDAILPAPDMIQEFVQAARYSSPVE